MNREISGGGFAVVSGTTGEPVRLALQELSLTGRLLPVGATLQVRHVFRSEEKQPLEVVYAFVLPRDAALRRFTISGEAFSVESELRPTVKAVASYEKAIENGRLTSLLRQYKDGMVNLNVGNIRPGETVVVQLEILAGVELRDDGLRFRFPFTLAPTYQAGVRGVEVESGVGELACAADFDRLLPRWMERVDGLHRVGFELTVAMPNGVVEVGSPSHLIRVRREVDGQCRVSLAATAEVPDRDLVLDVRNEGAGAGVSGGLAADGTGHFAVVLPSTMFGELKAARRRLVFVVDRSGSMEGPAMNQARQAVEACLGALSSDDQFGIVAFDNTVESLAGERLLNGSGASRDEARRFLSGIEARGGTELAAGLMVGVRMLGAEGGEVLLLTDGQVAGTENILASARATGVRLHCLGIGSASQDRFLTLLARETGGVSRFVTPRERVDMAALELFASIGRPVATGLSVEAVGSTFAPTPPAVVFAGTPLLLFGELNGETETAVRLSWDGTSGRRSLDLPVRLAISDEAESVKLLQGSRLITDIEARCGSGETSREEGRRRRALLKLSVRYGLACQHMSLVAVVRRQGDQPGEVPKTMVVPVGMPQDVEFDSYFGCQTASSSFFGMPEFKSPAPNIDRYSAAEFALPTRQKTDHSRYCAEEMDYSDRVMACYSDRSFGGNENDDNKDNKKVKDGVKGWLRSLSRFISPINDNKKVKDRDDDLLVKLAGLMFADGGMPGKDGEERWVVTAIALLCFKADGKARQSDAFRAHSARLLAYLNTAPEMAPEMANYDQKQRLVVSVNSGTVLPGDWATLARQFIRERRVDQTQFWKLVASS